MVENVTNHKLYHVTVAAPYKTALTANQVIHVGGSHNPFFGFYENALDYPVNQNGSIIQVRAGAWLNRVRDGTITPDSPPRLANIAAEVAQHYIMLVRELIMEEMRVSEFREHPSRQNCLYTADTWEGAQLWNKTLGGAGTICELSCTGTIHRANSSLLLEDSEPLSLTRNRARQYWQGDVGPEAIMETLFVGDALVSAIGNP